MWFVSLFFSHVKVCTKNAICFPILECVESLITAIGLAPCHQSKRKKKPCVRLPWYPCSQNLILREMFLPKQLWTGKVVGNISMSQINFELHLFTWKICPAPKLHGFWSTCTLLDCCLLRLISWEAQSTGTNSEQESLIWKQFLIKKQQNVLRLPITTEKQLIAWLAVWGQSSSKDCWSL